MCLLFSSLLQVLQLINYFSLQEQKNINRKKNGKIWGFAWCVRVTVIHLYLVSHVDEGIYKHIYFYIYVYVSVYACMGILGFMYFALWFRLCFVNKWPYIEREQ